MLISMSKPKGARPTVRRLEAIGRFEAIPPMLTVERVTVLGSVPVAADPPLQESKTTLIEDYSVVSDADAADPDAVSVADRVARALPRNSFEAKTAGELAESMEISVRSVRHGLDELGSQVARRGAGTRWHPLKCFIPVTPNLKELSGTEAKDDTKGGETRLAIQADERGPPERADTAVHEKAGAEESPGNDPNSTT